MSATYSLTNGGVILHSFEYARGEWLTTQMLNMEIGLSDNDLPPSPPARRSICR